MSCARCSSLNQAEFTSEMMIHFSGPGHLANPGILAFPKIWICLDCGASRFIRQPKNCSHCEKLPRYLRLLNRYWLSKLAPTMLR